MGVVLSRCAASRGQSPTPLTVPRPAVVAAVFSSGSRGVTSSSLLSVSSSSYLVAAVAYVASSKVQLSVVSPYRHRGAYKMAVCKRAGNDRFGLHFKQRGGLPAMVTKSSYFSDMTGVVTLIRWVTLRLSPIMTTERIPVRLTFTKSYTA